ncbi:PREDICTED: uncharacterized protein LOC109129476 [Camelina sativa]|uniref:Uncharacterized protein LOC109129476 n=1 Tax=Camelina sativa TaxID=90675 RepID=A0ABM1R2P8_CAMSA|nr:PREDICTED: uncharacterized protein LOC109129476 [Camelina sativa]
MSIKNVVFLLAAICVVVSVNAQLPQFPALFPFPFPFQPIPGVSGLLDITKCWSVVMDIPGCVTEIAQSIFTGKFGNIGLACCKAFLDAEANCMPKIPFNPFFPPMLKEKCSRIAGAGASPPTPK